jgi:hypothetical protein
MSEYEKLYNHIKSIAKKMVDNGTTFVVASQPFSYNSDGIPESRYHMPSNKDFFFIDYDSSFR